METLKRIIDEMIHHSIHVFGGQHTKETAVRRLIRYRRMLTDPPSPYYKAWPCLLFAFPGPFTDYLVVLDMAGELDNEAIQLPVSWADRLLRWRQRWEHTFTNYENWLMVRQRQSKEVASWQAAMEKTIPGEGSNCCS